MTEKKALRRTRMPLTCAALLLLSACQARTMQTPPAPPMSAPRGYHALHLVARQTPTPEPAPDPQTTSTPLLLFGGVAIFLFVVVGIVLLARRK